mgnify:CR=1 FL=1
MNAQRRKKKTLKQIQKTRLKCPFITLSCLIKATKKYLQDCDINITAIRSSGAFVKFTRFKEKNDPNTAR